ncbi:MAG TPA: hypothetical protein VIR57_06645 [Chloroflexota bacterium]
MSTSRHQRWLLPAAAVTLVGAFFRFFRLDRLPFGFYFDEAANAFDITALGRDFHPIYFTANNGREPLFFYWAAVFVRTLTVTPFSMRVAAAFIGVLTVPAVYFCFSQLLRNAEGPAMSRRIALFAAGVCAVLFFHVIFSRIGLRTISLPLFECLSFGLLWQAARRRSWWRFLTSGILLALCLYTYTAARLLIGGLAVYAAYCLLFQRKSIAWRGWGISLASLVLAATPLGYYGFTHLNDFFQRTEGIAVTDRAAVLHGTFAVLGMFLFKGTDEGIQNIAGMPVFDAWMGAMFAIGLLLCLRRLRQPAYVFALVWLVSIIPASALSPSPPYYLRLTGLIPPMVMLPALALAELPGLVARALPAARRAWAYAPPAALLLATAGLTFYHYFDVWPKQRLTFLAMMQDKVESAPHLNGWAAAGNRVFLAPLYAQDWTYRWLTRGQPIQSFEATACAVLPPRGQDAVYAYPPFDNAQPPALLAHLPGSPWVERISDSQGQPLLVAIHEASADLPLLAAQLAGNFGGEMGLVRVDGIPSGPVRPGATVQLLLVWQALEKMDANYTAFVHADDDANHRRIGHDSMPCAASHVTSSWAPGEEILDYYTLQVPPDAPDGAYSITTGLYTLPDLRNLKVNGGDATDLRIGSFAVAR